jgi:hypothetical protein
VIVVAELDTPFDELESPTTVATPSCCCCCCCCLASITSAAVVAGRIVARDLSGSEPPPSQRTRWTLVTAAVLAPILAAVVAVALAAEEQIDSLFGVVATFIALTGAMLFAIRLTASGRPRSAALMAIALPVATGGAMLVEIFAVLFTIGFFWLTIPFWVWLALRATAFDPGEPPPSSLPPWLQPPPATGVAPTEAPPAPPPRPAEPDS